MTSACATDCVAAAEALIASGDPLRPIIELAAELGIEITDRTARNWARGRGGLPVLPALIAGGRLRSTKTAFRAWLATSQPCFRRGAP